MKLGRLLGTATLVTLVATSISSGCDVTEDGGECSRLREFSCDCFPGCQEGDIDVTNSQDDARCKARLGEQFEYWKKGCLGRCALDADCLFGWGGCAARYYRQIGLIPEGICTSAGSAGVGGGDAAADVRAD